VISHKKQVKQSWATVRVDFLFTCVFFSIFHDVNFFHGHESYTYEVLSAVVSKIDYRHNTENLKQTFPEKELRGLSPNFHIHASVSDLYIPMIGLPILLQENMWTDPGNI
jgi:hypothetical protein